MKDLKFISSKKSEIPAKYLEQLFILMQKNTEEIFNYPPPTIDYYKKSWLFGLESSEEKYYVLTMDNKDNLLGYGYCSWNIKYDNLDKGYFWIYVAKDQRRKGLGKKILKGIVKIYPEQITCVVTDAFSNTDGISFVESLKIPKHYEEVLSISDLTKFNIKKVKEEVKKQRNEAAKKGYDFHYFENMNQLLSLEKQIYVKMVEEIWNDMPLEDLSFEKDVLTVERFQEMQKTQLLIGERIMTFIVIHKESNTPVGLTSTFINEHQPEVAKQEDTGILKKHRGKGLGLALKYQMLQKLLTETEAKIWRTGNAGSNEHMLRINRILKYEPIIKIPVFEIQKDVLEKRLNEI